MKKAIICDIDGTLAHMNGKRGPFEWHNVDVDDVDLVVKELVELYSRNGYRIIFVSGRDGSASAKTIEWLQKNVDIEGGYDLYMRTESDVRPDTVVKDEIYFKLIEPFHNVAFVLDDRPKVIRMWRDLGLKVLDCGNGVEF